MIWNPHDIFCFLHSYESKLFAKNPMIKVFSVKILRRVFIKIFIQIIVLKCWVCLERRIIQSINYCSPISQSRTLLQIRSGWIMRVAPALSSLVTVMVPSSAQATLDLFSLPGTSLLTLFDAPLKLWIQIWFHLIYSLIHNIFRTRSCPCIVHSP